MSLYDSRGDSPPTTFYSTRILHDVPSPRPPVRAPPVQPPSTVTSADASHLAPPQKPQPLPSPSTPPPKRRLRRTSHRSSRDHRSAPALSDSKCKTDLAKDSSPRTASRHASKSGQKKHRRRSPSPAIDKSTPAEGHRRCPSPATDKSAHRRQRAEDGNQPRKIRKSNIYARSVSPVNTRSQIHNAYMPRPGASETSTAPQPTEDQPLKAKSKAYPKPMTEQDKGKKKKDVSSSHSSLDVHQIILHAHYPLNLSRFHPVIAYLIHPLRLLKNHQVLPKLPWSQSPALRLLPETDCPAFLRLWQRSQQVLPKHQLLHGLAPVITAHQKIHQTHPTLCQKSSLHRFNRTPFSDR